MIINRFYKVLFYNKKGYTSVYPFPSSKKTTTYAHSAKKGLGRKEKNAPFDRFCKLY